MSIAFLVFLLGAAQAGSHLGCYRETLRSRHFNINPGDHRPELTTVKTCMAACGMFDFMYSATTSGKFCYCSDSLPDAGSKEADSYCDMACSGDGAIMCGGARHASVYRSSKPITGLELTSDAVNSIIAVNTPVALAVSIDQGMDVIYKMDYDDGAGRSSPNITGMLSRTFYIPGEYSIQVYANDQNETFEDVVAATAVRVDAPAGQLQVDCDPFFATHEEGTCVLTAWSGSELNLDINVDAFSYNFKAEDPPLSLAGPGVKAKEAEIGDDTARVYVMPASEFGVSGKVLGWELYVMNPGSGTLNLLILSPKCPSSYCYSDNACTAGACDSAYQRVTDCPANKFCMQYAICETTPSCTAATSRYASPPTDYEVKSNVAVTVSGSGYLYIPEATDVLVEPGDILGLHHSAGNVLLGHLSASSPDLERQYADGTSTPSTVFAGSGMSSTAFRHAIRAVASGGSKVHLPFTFTNAGNHTLTATAQSTSLSGTPQTSITAIVRVLEGVNFTIIDGPEFAKTGAPVTFTILPHTGNDAFYNWTFDSVSFLETTDISKSYTFSDIGVFVVNVTTYNSVSFKNNHTYIQIEEELIGLKLSTAPATELGVATDIQFSLTNGSNYSCKWDWGDSASDTTDDFSTPGAGATQQHTYASIGDYTVTVNCTNNVSTVQETVPLKVQERITNLRMTPEGANKHTSFFLEWAVDSGSEITFDLTFNGNPITDINVVSNYAWKSNEQPGRAPENIPVILTASNKINNLTVNVNFVVLSAIINPTFTTPEPNATSHTAVTFTADMDSGSDVTISIDWDDGSSVEEWNQTAGVEWATSKDFTHSFYNGGVFDVTATFSNKAGSFPRVATVTILVGPGVIQCVMEKYHLYHPPAYVNMTLVASQLPTEPTLYLNWGDVQSNTLQPELILNKTYKHTFGDTGTYFVNITIENILDTYQGCSKEIVVVEHLDNPSYQQEFTKAAKNMPFDVNFCLHRGPAGAALCNLTVDFDDGNGQQVIPRTGSVKRSGQDGCDLLQVTYTDSVTKTVSIVATTPLETVSKQLSVPIINGIDDSFITVDPVTNVNFGSPTFITVKYTGGTAPTSPRIKYIYGDNGNTEEDDNAFSSPNTQDHEYRVDGTFNATVIVYNDATRVERNFTVGVYQPFTNMQATVYYKKEHPPGEEAVNGFGGTGVYPQNKPIYFRFTTDNDATADTYTATVTDGSGAVTNYEFTTSEFFINFTTLSSFTVDVRAENPLHNEDISISVNILELVEGMRVEEQALQVSANEPKIFDISFITQGTDTCLYIDFVSNGRKMIFSDNLPSCTDAGYASVPAGDKGALTGLSSVEHTYTTDNYYEVTFLAKNSQSQEEKTVGFSITGMDCAKPSVDIHNRHNYFTNPEPFKRSEKIQIRGESNIQCAVSYENTKGWRVEKMDPDYDTVVGVEPLSTLDTTKAELNFPARFLNLGLYRVHYEMTMAASESGGSTFKSTSYTYIQVGPSDIIAVMVNGGVSEITRGQDALSSLVLKPIEYSFDPDVEPLPSDQKLEVKSWKCHLKSDENDVSGCTAGGFVDGRQDTQTLDLSAMPVETYKISALVVKTDDEDRQSETDVFVVVVAGNPPSVTILPRQGSVYFQQSDGYRILESSRFSMSCNCDTCGGSEDDLSYEWKLYLDDYRWPDGWRYLEDSDTDERVLGRKSKEISIEASLFSTFQATIMKVQCDITNPSGVGSVSTKLTVNSPPSGGTCVITPLNRTYTPDKAWKIDVDGWADVDGLLKYQFFLHTSDDEVDRQITSLDIVSPSDSLQVSLSEGYKFNNYEEKVLIAVYDKLNAIVMEECGTVTVRPMDPADSANLMNDILSNEMNDLNKLYAEGDVQECTQKMTSVFSSLNSAIYAGYDMASNHENSMYGQMDNGRPSYQKVDPATIEDEEGHFEMESSRNDRIEIRTNIIEKLGDLPVESMTAVIQVTSTLNQAGQHSDEINQDTQNRIMDEAEKVTEWMMDPANLEGIPTENVESAISNVLGVVGNTMSSAGLNGDFPSLDDMVEAQNDTDFFIYDTDSDMEIDLEMEQAADFDAALEIHKARIHKKRQAATAERVRQKTMKVADNAAKLFSAYSVPGQALKINTLKLKATMEKTEMNQVAGKQIGIEGSAGGATFPLDMFANSLDPNVSVVISVTQSTSHPLLYSEAAQAISPTTNFVSVNIYDKKNTKLQVDGMPEPIKVVIPRDSNANTPPYSPMDPKIPSWNNLMNFVADIQRSSCTLFMEFDNIKDRQFLLVVKVGEEPKIRENVTCDSVFLMPSSMSRHENESDTTKYKFQLNSEDLDATYPTKIYVGVRELNATEFDMDISGGCDALPRYENGSDYFRGNFSLRQYVSQCLAIGDKQTDWSTDGCSVSGETAVDKTVCLCNHLTTFAGGWVVVPNTIDWGYVFANADFLSNPTIYVTQIVIVTLFIAGIIYARLQDKKMAEKLGLAPLEDNDPKDKYFYEVIVCTGMRRNAGTNSQACFILSGEDDETDIRAFHDSKRKIFKRGEVDGFLMTVPRCLGYLNFMRVWHDNSGKGKFGSWYLNYVIVRDVQTGDKQVFVCNKWLAVEEDDGQVDRVIPVAGREQLADFSYQFGERTRKNLADGHLWFSVVARPPQSRFTCVQRVSCILCLLYVTMLANAMFYNTAPQDEQTNNAFNIGPFSVSPEQLFIGVISNLIVFPVNFLLVFLFRKTRPRHKRPSRIDRAIQENNDQTKQASPNDIKPEVSSIFSVSKSPTIPPNPHRPDTAGSRPATAMSMGQESYPDKKKKCELPWYFLIISWVLLVLVTLGAGMMVTFYGISFKDETCKKWISSMLVSFFMSVFITQPIKVFLFAVILSIIIKNPSEEKEDEDDDEEIHHTNYQDNEFLHQDADGFGATRPRKIGYKPPDPALLEKYRQKRLKEIKMWGIVREVIMYVFFLWILLVISYRQLGPANFLFKDTMHRVFIANNDTHINFNDIRDTDEFWTWTKSGMVNGIRAGSYYNDYPPLKLRSFVNDKVSRILGYATMRQLRIKPALCEIPDEMEDTIAQCNVMYHILDQQQDSFLPGWVPFASNQTTNDTRTEYTYTRASELNGYPYWGTLAWYSGGGYVVPLTGSKTDLMNKMDQLHLEGWIDKYTRAIFVEFTVYNPQVNLFSINTILAEFHPSGGLVQSFRFEPAMLLPYMDSAMLFQLVIQGVFVGFTLFFILRESRELVRTRFAYFKSFWNLVEIGIIGMSVAAVVIYFYRLFVTLDLTDQFKSTNGNGYVKFQYVGYWNEMLSYMIGFLVFLASLKFLKLLRFNKKITLLSATLHHSARSLLHFSIIYTIVFLAFAQLFYLTYMNIDISYSTFVNSVVASVLMMMGKFNIYTMIMKEPVLTQVFVLLFVITVTFIMVNMFISILNETFTVVREDINKQGNDYEIVDFMVNSFRKWTGIGGVPQDHDVDANEWNNRKNKTSHPGRDPNSDPDCVDDFPDRIDRLLQSISAVYTDNDNFAKMYSKKPYQSGQQQDPKGLLRQGRSPSPGPGRFSRKDSSDALAKVHTH